MGLLDVVFYPYRTWQQWRAPAQDNPLELLSTRVIFKIDDQEKKPKKMKSCSIKWLWTWCREKASQAYGKGWQTVNTIALFSLGFNTHRMQKMAQVSDPLMSTHRFAGLNIPPTHFATLPKVAQTIATYHRDECPFIIDNGPGSIFALIVDMLDDHDLVPDDLIFTCSKSQTKANRSFINTILAESVIMQQRQMLHNCAKDNLTAWASTGTEVDFSKTARDLVCDMMSRYFLGTPDSKRYLSKVMDIFFHYILARFAQQKFDTSRLAIARTLFWKIITTAIHNDQSLVGKIFAQGAHSEKQLKMLIFSLFFAGIDSTTKSFVYTTHKCTNQKRQATLRNSLQELSHKKNKLPVYEFAHEITPIQQIIAESLRMFPPVIGVVRVARENLKVVTANQQSTLLHRASQGDLLAPSPNIIARCPILFSNPDRFDPERHDTLRKLTALPWQPFGGGLNLCPGWKLYEVFMEIYLAELLLHYKTSCQQQSEIPQKGSFINRLSQHVHIKFDFVVSP